MTIYALTAAVDLPSAPAGAQGRAAGHVQYTYDTMAAVMNHSRNERRARARRAARAARWVRWFVALLYRKKLVVIHMSASEPALMSGSR